MHKVAVRFESIGVVWDFPGRRLAAGCASEKFEYHRKPARFAGLMIDSSF